MISQWLCQSNICHCIFKLLRVIMHYLSTLIQTIQLCDLGNLGNFWAYIYGQLSVYSIDWLIEIKHVLATNQHFPGNSDPFSIKPTVVPVEICPPKIWTSQVVLEISKNGDMEKEFFLNRKTQGFFYIYLEW